MVEAARDGEAGARAGTGEREAFGQRKEGVVGREGELDRDPEPFDCLERREPPRGIEDLGGQRLVELVEARRIAVGQRGVDRRRPGRCRGAERTRHRAAEEIRAGAGRADANAGAEIGEGRDRGHDAHPTGKRSFGCGEERERSTGRDTRDRDAVRADVRSRGGLARGVDRGCERLRRDLARAQPG